MKASRSSALLACATALLAASCARPSAPSRPVSKASPVATIVNLGPVPHPVGAFHITDMSFADRLHGWVFGQFAGFRPHVIAMERTKDGGRTWLQTPVPVPRAGVVRHVLFANASLGWTYGPDLYVSRDGGLSWDRQFPGGDVSTLSVAGTALWAAVRPCGDCAPVLEVSRNEGRTWVRAGRHPAARAAGRPGTSRLPNGLAGLAKWAHFDFVDSTHGWIGTGKVVYGTIDGGRHWRMVTLHPDGCGCIHHVLAP